MTWEPRTLVLVHDGTVIACVGSRDGSGWWWWAQWADARFDDATPRTQQAAEAAALAWLRRHGGPVRAATTFPPAPERESTP